MSESLAAYKAGLRSKFVFWLGIAAAVGGFVIRDRANDRWAMLSARGEDFHRTAGTYLLGLSLVLFGVIARRWTQPPPPPSAQPTNHPPT